jgi:hypothetical protein
VALTTEIISFGGGVLTGLLTNVIWDQRYRFTRRFQMLTKREPDVLGFSSQSVDLYPINRWTYSHQLHRSRLSMTVAPQRPRQRWVDEIVWKQLVEEFARANAGDIAYLIDFAIDHRESERANIFHYTVAPCDYSEHLATVQYLKSHTDAQSRIRQALRSGSILEFARTAPPSSIKINVAVLNANARWLAVQRSGSVQTKSGLWTVGPNETMKLSRAIAPGTRTEDLFGLAERCLREELGLEPADYREVNVSWMGYEAETACVKVFAQVATRLSELEIAECIASAHSLFEMQDYLWLPLRRRAIMDIIARWDSGDSSGRLWSSSAPLALQELWRMRRALRPMA